MHEAKAPNLGSRVLRPCPCRLSSSQLLGYRALRHPPHRLVVHASNNKEPKKDFNLQSAWQALRSIFTPRPARPIQLEGPPAPTEEPREEPQEELQGPPAIKEQIPTTSVTTQQELQQQQQPGVTAAAEPALAETAHDSEIAAAVQPIEVTAGAAVMEREVREEATTRLEAQVVKEISKVPQAEWDACANGSGEVNPFLLWAFLHALEESGSAVSSEGWMPQHVLLRDSQTQRLLACCPMYLKTHSQGEYVFDHSWAHAAMYTGQRYYPKLQCCVPFSPVTGPRLLVHPDANEDAMREAMGKIIASVAEEFKVSSVHMTFNTQQEWAALATHGYLQRTGIQYHWYNGAPKKDQAEIAAITAMSPELAQLMANGSSSGADGSVTNGLHSNGAAHQSGKYGSFDEFLMTLKQPKRKAIRQERKAIAKEGLKLDRKTGADLTPAVWDEFYRFYRNTTDHKWGSAYLTREFFHRLGDSMADHVVLATAQEHGSQHLMAGALNLLGSHALFGRNWGCASDCWVKHLHFELCYYQALEEAIERGLERVEAGAQGEHKIQRGYLPRLTYSSHYICSPALRERIQGSLRRDRAVTAYTLEMLTKEASPYKS